MTNRKISDQVGLHVNQVGKWRRRFLENQERLNAISIEKPHELESELFSVLGDAPRSGAPTKFTADQHALIVMIACQNPSDHGIEASNWSLPKLKKTIIDNGVVTSISEASINRILNENKLKPHKNRYWLHSIEKAKIQSRTKQRSRRSMKHISLLQRFSELRKQNISISFQQMR